MRPGDVSRARNLWSRSEGVDLGRGDSPADVRRYLRRNPGMSFVAMRRGLLVGAVMAGHDGRRGILYHLAVARSARRAGVGTALVEASLDALRREGIGRVLILVARGNRAGKAFWSRSGWAGLEFAQPMAIDL
jgi:N-acetylglutamate synthase